MPSEICKPYRLFPSVRFFMLIIVVFGCTSIGGGFGAFNFAIICMVADTGENLERSKAQNESCLNNTSKQFDSSQSSYDGEFNWDKDTQASLLSTYAWGSVPTTLISGVLSDRCGSKMLFTAGLLCNIIASAFTPMAAYAGVGWLMTVRILQGMSSGLSWPPVMTMVARWSTATDRSTFITMGAIGYQIGPLLALATSSSICASTYRWPLIFYLWAALCAAAVIPWFLFYNDDPSKCRLLSKAELCYITMDKAQQLKNAKAALTTGEEMQHTGPLHRLLYNLTKIPWRHIVFSRSVATIYIAMMCGMWTVMLIIEFVPTYTKEVLRFDLQTNGLVSMLPVVFICLAHALAGPIADRLKFGQRSVTFSIKVFGAAAFSVPTACFILLSFLDREQRNLVVVLFCVIASFWSLCTVSYLRSGTLVAPQYSGLICALADVCGFIVGGIVMSYVIGAMTAHGTFTEWRAAMWLSAAISFIGGLQFMLWGSGVEQDWAKTEPKLEEQCTPKVQFTL